MTVEAYDGPLPQWQSTDDPNLLTTSGPDGVTWTLRFTGDRWQLTRPDRPSVIWNYAHIGGLRELDWAGQQVMNYNPTPAFPGQPIGA